MYDTVLVTGNRDFKDFELVRDLLLENLTCQGNGVLLVGDATGADRLALWASHEEGCWLTLPHKADWDQYRKAAGPMRNEVMIQHAREVQFRGSRVLVLAFALEPGVEFATKGGAAYCLRRARSAGLPYEFYVSKRHTGENRWKELPSSSYLLSLVG